MTNSENWKLTTLGEVATLQHGFSFQSGSFVSNGKLPVIRIGNIKDWRVVVNDAVSVEEDNQLAPYVIRRDDLIIALTGGDVSNLETATGRVGLYQEKFPSVLNQRVARIDVDENKAEKQFIYFTFANRPAVYSLASIANGSAQKNLTTEHVLNFPIALPPLPEQKSIAAVLSSLDDKIELLRAQNKTLEEMAQRLFKEWFVDFNFSNSDGKPYKASGGKMVKSEIGEIPEGWNMGQVRELVDVLSGFAFRSNTFMDGGLYKLVTIRNVQDGTFVSETRNQLESIPSNMPYYCKLQNGDVLLSLTGNVGRVCQVVGDDYLLNQRVAKLQPKQFEDSGFMFLLFRQPEMIGILEHLASGTAQQNLSPVKTGTMTILLPPRNFLDMFGEKINPMLDKVLKNKEQIQTLSKLRDTMLPKLMNGEIVVSNK